MKIIVGLGNPGFEYHKTRHNLGFLALDKIAATLGDQIGPFDLKNKFSAEVAETFGTKEKIILVKPQTFMNNSGEAVQKIVSFYKIDAKKDLLVIYDDKDLELGEIRERGRSAGGHKGMDSIIKMLKTEEIARLRLGIKSDALKQKPTGNFVLEKLSKNETEILEKEVFPKVVQKVKLNLS